MLNDIKSQFPDAKVSLSSEDSEDNKKYGNYEYYNNISTVIINRTKNKFFKLIKFLIFLLNINVFYLFKNLKIKPYFLFNKRTLNKLNSYKKFDLVIASGGGYMLTRNNISIISRIINCYDFYFASYYNKPYILYNQSIGPFNNKYHIYILKHYFKSALKIICRDSLSFERLSKIGLKNIILSTDIAYNLKVKKCNILNKYHFNQNDTNIGLTIRDWLPKYYQEKYEDEIAKFINEKIESNNKNKFYFYPQVIFAKNKDDDRIGSKRILDKIKDDNKKNVKIIYEDLHPSEIKFLISKMDYFIGTRMHSNIFSLSSKVKTIAIAYEPKTFGIMKDLGLSEYVLKIEDVSKSKLHILFDLLVQDDSYITKLKKGLNHIKRKLNRKLLE